MIERDERGVAAHRGMSIRIETGTERPGGSRDDDERLLGDEKGTFCFYRTGFKLRQPTGGQVGGGGGDGNEQCAVADVTSVATVTSAAKNEDVAFLFMLRRPSGAPVNESNRGRPASDIIRR